MTPQRKDLKYPAVSELRGIQLKKTFALDLNMHFYSGIYSVVIKYHDTPQGFHIISTAAPNTIAYVCKQLCVLYFFSRFNEWIWATSAFEIFSDAVFKGRCTVQSGAASQVCRAQRDLERLWHRPFSLSLCDSAIWLACVCVRLWPWEQMFVHFSVWCMCAYAGLYLLEWLVTEVFTA